MIEKKLWHRLKKLESEEMGYLDKLITVLITDCNSIGRPLLLYFLPMVYNIPSKIWKFFHSQFLSIFCIIFEKLVGILLPTSGDPDQIIGTERKSSRKEMHAINENCISSTQALVRHFFGN